MHLTLLIYLLRLSQRGHSMMVLFCEKKKADTICSSTLGCFACLFKREELLFLNKTASKLVPLLGLHIKVLLFKLHYEAVTRCNTNALRKGTVIWRTI